MSTHEAPTTTFGAHGDGCAACGAVLAPDQRYCLACGARRTDARLAFMELLRAQAQGVAVARTPHGAPAAPATAPAPRPRANVAMVAAVGCLLMAMGIGVLIGRAGHDQPRPAAVAPQIIKVQSAAPAPAAPAAAVPGAAGLGAGAGSTPKSKAGKPPAKATNKSLQQLDKLSPDAYQKQSGKLPKEVGTGGKAPPKDTKPAAGGGGFESIG